MSLILLLPERATATRLVTSAVAIGAMFCTILTLADLIMSNTAAPAWCLKLSDVLCVVRFVWLASVVVYLNTLNEMYNLLACATKCCLTPSNCWRCVRLIGISTSVQCIGRIEQGRLVLLEARQWWIECTYLWCEVSQLLCQLLLMIRRWLLVIVFRHVGNWTWVCDFHWSFANKITNPRRHCCDRWQPRRSNW